MHLIYNTHNKNAYDMISKLFDNYLPTKYWLVEYAGPSFKMNSNALDIAILIS